MTMDKKTIRKAFERTYLGGNKQTARQNEHGEYVLSSIQDAWAGWYAALSVYSGHIFEKIK